MLQVFLLLRAGSVNIQSSTSVCHYECAALCHQFSGLSFVSLGPFHCA